MKRAWIGGDIGIVLCLAVFGLATEARAADCQYVRGSITETVIPSPYDQFGRTLGIVDGVLKGASTASITSIAGLNATSVDVFVTKRGDMLTAEGAVALTPVPGAPPGEFTLNVKLSVTGGSGKYAGATKDSILTFEGQAHNFFGGPGVATANVVYRGFICGPNVNGTRD